jgi:hypothetical protein
MTVTSNQGLIQHVLLTDYFFSSVSQSISKQQRLGPTWQEAEAILEDALDGHYHRRSAATINREPTKYILRIFSPFHFLKHRGATIVNITINSSA